MVGLGDASDVGPEAGERLQPVVLVVGSLVILMPPPDCVSAGHD